MTLLCDTCGIPVRAYRRNIDHPPELIDAIFSHWGKESARDTAGIYGLTRNAIIGIWWRERRRLGIEPIRRRRVPPELRRQPAPRKPKPITQARRAAAPLPESLLVLFADRAKNQCAYIAGEPTWDATCCGHTALEGFSYCPAHAAHCHRVRE